MLNPMMVVYVEVAGQTYLIEVGVVDCLAQQVTERQDVPILKELIQSSKAIDFVTKLPETRVEEGGGGG